MCLASASIRQYRLFPQESDHFFNRPNMIGNARFRRSSSEAKVPVPGHRAVSENRLFLEFESGRLHSRGRHPVIAGSGTVLTAINFRRV
jgi:hypothetical protein